MTAQDFLIRHIGTMTIQYAASVEKTETLEQQQGVTLSTLYECVVSGQVDEAGIARLLQDPMFTAYYNKRKGK